MDNITINELKKLCEEQIKKGNGNKKILISDDDEGNGYHELFYSFMSTKELEKYMFTSFPVDKEELKNYIILG